MIELNEDTEKKKKRQTENVCEQNHSIGWDLSNKDSACCA